MKKVELVIEMSEDVYETIKKRTTYATWAECLLGHLINNATSLPKGHGALVDISQIDKDMIESGNPIICLEVNGEYIEAVSLDYLSGLQAIVEADESEE